VIKLLNILSEQMGDSGDLPRGCAKYPNRSLSKKLCATLNKSTYRKITYPLIRKVFDMKKQKWNAVMSPEEQERTLSTLSRLKDLDPTRKWQWPSETDKITYGTIEEFINGRIPELGFLYREVDGNLEWDPVNKLDTNYSDLAVLITDIVEKSKTFTSEDLLNDLNDGNIHILQNVVDVVSNYPEILYDKFISKSDLYTTQSLYYSLQGEEIEDFVLNSMLDCGWELIHKGGGGDIIDVFLGIDLIMEKDGELKTIQCKKVWKIENLPSTIMNPDSGAYRITGNVYVSKQRNVDLVGYGTLDGETIIGGRQKEVVMKDKQYVYTDKMVLPKPEGSRYFYVDNPICTNIGGTLSEQVSPNSDKLIKAIQSIVDQFLLNLEKETEEMGLGEMEYINEIESIENVRVVDYFRDGSNNFVLNIVMGINNERRDFDSTLSELYLTVNKLIPNTTLKVKIDDGTNISPLRWMNFSVPPSGAKWDRVSRRR